MTDEAQPLKPEHVFKKIVWRNTLAFSESLGHATTWSITGIAAIAGLLVSNLDSVSKLVSSDGLRWSIILFTASLVMGALSKQFGMAIAKGLALVNRVEELLFSEKGQALVTQLSTPFPTLVEEMAEPFWWPLSALIKRAGRRGMKDYLAADKRFIRMFCFQLAFVYLHGLFAAFGLIVIAASIVT